MEDCFGPYVECDEEKKLESSQSEKEDLLWYEYYKSQNDVI
jgi:hypothetical protein